MRTRPRKSLDEGWNAGLTLGGGFIQMMADPHNMAMLTMTPG
jgi:hypothetical protein